MDMMVPFLVLFAILALWTFLPFQPALRELREKRDVEPVRVEGDSEVDVRYFARGYRSFLQENFADVMARCRAERRGRRGRLADETSYVVLDGEMEQEPPDVTREASYPHLIVSCGMLRLPSRTVFPLELYAESGVAGGETSVYRAILAGEDIQLARGTISLRWLHAGGSIRVDGESRLHGRVSADREIQLAPSTGFERLHAPRILFGREAGFGEAAFWSGPEAEPKRSPLDSKEVKHLVQVAAGRWLVKGRLRIPPERSVQADLVATEDADIGERAHILGSVKTHKDVVVRGGAVVDGSVVSGRDLYLEAGCRIRGPVLAEGAIVLGPGCEIGSEREPTTVSARSIRAVAHSVAHGTVWAHDGGLVVDEREEARA
jgi:cytoskeletal protein CcmA (bactofilin family)